MVRPITVEEYHRIPNPPGGRYELHHGELAFVTFPVRQHKELQRRLRRMLEAMPGAEAYLVDTEFPYRPFPEDEVWRADVACVSGVRYDAVDQWLEDSPELLIEVKSPSNTKAEMHDKAMTTLAGVGAVEFWIVRRGNQNGHGAQERQRHACVRRRGIDSLAYVRLANGSDGTLCRVEVGGSRCAVHCSRLEKGAGTRNTGIMDWTPA